MKPSKPLVMKTYGKQMRKMSAWLSPENRKKVFDSSVSTDGDVSVFEPLTRPKRPRVSISGRVGRLAKKKAMLCLAEKSLNEGSSSSSSFESTHKRKPVRHDCPPKKKAKIYKSKTSSDENVRNPPSPQTTQQKKDTSDNLPLVGRFVTQRRRTITAKRKNPKASLNLVDSSVDFASGALGCSRFNKPRRRNVPPTFVISSAENSRISSFAPNTLKEISLNALSDHTLGSCPRKPIFCSTPSAGRFSIRPCLQSTAVSHTSDKLGSPASLSVYCTGGLNLFPQDLDSLWQSPPLLAPELHSDEKLSLSFGEGEPSTKSSKKTRSWSREAQNHSVGTENKNDGDSLSLNLFPTEALDSNSQFQSVSGELEWLTEALKEKCLRVPCTVQLQRLYSATVSQLCNQTTYSSFLGHSSKGSSYQTSEALHLHLSVTTNKSNASEQSVDTQSISPPRSKKHKRQSKSELSQISASGHWNPTAAEEQVENKSLTMKRSVRAKRQCVAQKNDRQPKRSQKEQSNNAVVLEEKNKVPASKTRRADDRYSTVGPERKDNLALAARLKEECLTERSAVEMKRLSLLQVKEILRSSRGDQVTHPELLDSSSDEQLKNHLRSDDKRDANEDTCESRTTLRKNGLTSSEDTVMSEQDLLKEPYNVRHKRKKASVAPRDKKRTTPADRPRTVRKACVSGLSVNRWKNKDASGIHTFGNTTAQSNRAVDCSISEMISTKSRKRSQAKEALESTVNFSTPLRVSRLNLSSLLTDFTPNTHTWSRIKAVLSVHRKGMVLQTLQNSGASILQTPRKAALANVSQDLFATPRSAISKRLPSQLLHNVPMVECADGDLSDAEKVYAECGQQCPLPWEKCILPQRMKQCVKIGEGTFGEVFSVINASGETVALKVIPVEGCEQVNGEDQKTFGEILHEIIISKELSHLKEKKHNQTNGFIGLNDLHCVQGCYPPDFMEAWDTFDQEKCSENDRPDFFKKDQIFLILEFEFGGADLENSNGTLASLGVAKSILHQVTAALAVAEQELHFEHRDLHWGNVLVKPTKQKQSSFLLNGAVRSVDTSGVLVRIIDYSLSRLEIDDLTVSCDISKDEELFMGQGDYQFEIYRLMRKQNGNSWSEYHPRTNVLWLHYLCSKLLSMKYRSSRGKAIKEAKEALVHFSNNVLQYSSATELLQSYPMFQK